MKTTLKLTRDTKNTQVYKNDEDGAPIPSLYIDKAAFKKEPPKTITVEIPEIK
jgi:hypothetical protein